MTKLRATSLFLGLAALLVPGTVAAHGPDPLLGGRLWAQDQHVTYRWRSGQTPPDWMRAAINAGAADSNASRASRAAVVTYSSGGASQVAYDEPTGCGAVGAACTSRGNAPVSFSMSFRRQGYVFDWGSLRWCQYYHSWPDGCYDAEAIALHEFGHVQDLGHHALYSSGSDFRDSVMNPIARPKPKSGYNVHGYERCDLATLQRQYDLPSSTTRVALCQSLDTTLTLSVSDTSVGYRDPVTFTAALRVTNASPAGRLGADALSGRTVVLQRRVLGTSGWVSLGAMGNGSTAGSYRSVQYPSTRYEWRAVFSEPDDEGLQGATSSTVTVSVTTCTGSGCPLIWRP